MRGRSRTRRSFTFRSAVAALTTLALLVGLSMTAAPAVAAASGPTGYWGAKAGPRDVPAPKLATVAALPLPAGRFFVTATAVLLGKGGSTGKHLGVGCLLQLGSMVDRVTAAPTWDDRDGSRVPILLTVAGRLGSPGKAKLRCVGETKQGNVRIRDMRISAIKVGKLTTRATVFLAGTIGSGSPHIISARSSLTTSVVGDDSYHDVGRLNLPAGRWWVIAKAVAENAGATATYTCSLSAGADHDDLRFGLSTPTWAGDAMPLGLQVVHEYATAPGTATLRCKAAAGFDIRQVTISAIEAGRLTNRALDDATQVTAGSGSPRIISGWSDGPLSVPVGSKFVTIRKLDLPKGRWMVLAKLWFEADSVPNDTTIRRTYCRLRFGKDKGPSQVQYANNVSRIAPLVLSVEHRSMSSHAVKLQCRRSAAGGNGNVHFIKITALKAGSLSRRNL